MEHVLLGDTVYAHFALSTPAGEGAAADGDWTGSGSGTGTQAADPDFFVREGGADVTAAPVYEGQARLLLHPHYPQGCYEAAVPATTGNGFAPGRTYAVFCAALVSAVNATGLVARFRTAPVPADAFAPDHAVAGTTLTVKYPDGSTAYTKTLDTLPDASADDVVGATTD